MGKSQSPCQGDFVGTSEDGVEISWPLFYETRHKDTPVAYLDPNVTSLREQTTTFWVSFQPKLLGCISGELSGAISGFSAVFVCYADIKASGVM